MNRKALLSAIFILCLPALLRAQPSVKKLMPVKIDLGVKVGVNLTSIAADEWESGMKPGFAAGLFGGVSAKRFGGQAEVLFSRVKYTGNGVDFYKRYGSSISSYYNNAADSAKHGDFAVSYLTVPILLNVKIGGPLWFQVGPQFSSLIGVNDKESLLKDTKGLFNSGEMAGVLGLQVKFAKLRLGGRYIIGLSDLSPSTVTNAWKQRTLQLYLGVSFL